MIPVTCQGKRAVAVSDQLRAVAKERLRSRVGAISDEEMLDLEDGLKQIMNLP